MLLKNSFTKSRISISGTPRQQREYLHFTSEGVTNFLQLYARLKWRSRGPRCELSLLYRCEEHGPWAESPGPAASSLLRGPSLDVLMALTFFNKHLEEPAEGLLLDTLSPQAYGNSCRSHADMSREALLARLASASAPGWEYTLYYMQNLPVHNTFKHVW